MEKSRLISLATIINNPDNLLNVFSLFTSNKKISKNLYILYIFSQQHFKKYYINRYDSRQISLFKRKIFLEDLKMLMRDRQLTDAFGDKT